MTVHYRDDEVTVHHGDCLDVLAELPDASVDAVVTDPPYNLAFMAKPWDAMEGREDAGFAYWLAGLIDGEGCFTIKEHARGTHAPAFALKLRADELGTLQRIQRTVGIGTIAREPHEPNPMAKWIVQDKAGCQRLVDLLDKYPLRAKKRIDYLTWREAVCEWTIRPRGNRWTGPADSSRMAGQRERLMANRAYVEIPWSGHEFQDWCRLWSAECLRILKPGGHMVSFGGSRTWHRLAAGIEDAGFEIRDSIAWLYGSGFPKSLDVSKAIDRAAGAEREVLRTIPDRWAGKGSVLQRSEQAEAESVDITAPATEQAQQWAGWGTALKPAFEPIVVARKPLAGTVAANVTTHGTGAMNIDGCRIGSGGQLKWSGPRGLGYNGAIDRGGEPTANEQGRWPANVILDEQQAAELDEQSGITRDGVAVNRNRPIGDDSGNNIYGRRKLHTGIDTGYGGEGGASRFFPVFRYSAKAPGAERPTVDGAAHPTVKPLDLMRWLVRLVTPPNGVVLDPFAGSGTTAEACIHEHMRCITIERESEYLPLIVARLSKPMAVGFDFGEGN